MTEDNFITITGWMRLNLGLKSHELNCYALIYGFSQTDEHYFTGSVDYVCDWLGCSRKTVFRTLQSLVDKGLIEKNDVIVNNIKYCKYKALRSKDKITPPRTKSNQGQIVQTKGQNVHDQGQIVLEGGVKNTPNNILNNIDNNIVNINTGIELFNKDSFDDIYTFDQFWNDYSKKVDLKKCKAHFKTLSNKDKEQIRDTVLNYVRINSDTKFRKNPLTYLNGKCWKDELIDYNIREPKKRKVNDGSDLYDIANG